MIAEAFQWDQITVAIIGVVGILLVEGLRRVKRQASDNAQTERDDSEKYAALQTMEHNVVADLLRESIANDLRMERSIDVVRFDTHEIRVAMRDHLESNNPHPQAGE